MIFSRLREHALSLIKIHGGKWRGALAIAIALMLTLAGCNASDDEPTGTANPGITFGSEDSASSTEGGVLHIAFITGQDDEELSTETPEPETTETGEPTDSGEAVVSPWNPLCPPNREMMDMHSLMFEGLIRFDSTMRVTPALAESWEYSEDMTMLTMKIREGAKFHDGTAVTADDVVHSFKLLRQYFHEGDRNSYYKNIARYVSMAYVVDKSTVEFSLAGIDMRALYAMNFPIVPISYTGNIDDMTIPKGTGPYRIESNNGREIVMETNEYWWRTQPKIKKVIARAMPDSDTCLTALEARQLDIVHTTSLTADRFKREGVTNSMELNSQQYECLLVNYDRKPLDNPYFREAIVSAIDRKSIINEVYLGHAVSVDAPIPPDSHLFSSNQVQHEYNPAHSIDILSRMSFEDADEDGILERKGTGVPFVMKLLVAENPLQNTRVDVAEIITEQLLKVGLQCEIEVAPWSQYKTKLNAQEFDLALAGFSVGVSGDLTFLAHSIDGRSVNGGGNYGGYYDMDMDELLESYTEQLQDSEAQYASAEIQQLFSEQMPCISLYFRNNSLLYSAAIKNITYARDMNIYANIEEWYIENATMGTDETDTPAGQDPATTTLNTGGDSEPDETSSPTDTNGSGNEEGTPEPKETGEEESATPSQAED